VSAAARAVWTPMRLAYPDPELTDGVVRLRRWSERDVACIEAAATDERIPAGTTVPAVFTADAGRAFVRRQWSRLEHGEGLSLAVADADGGEALGLAVLLVRPQPGVAGLGYWIVPAARRRGRAARAIGLLSGWALCHAEIARVEAWVDPGNEPSQRALASAGFVREGVLRAFLSDGARRGDAVVFSRTVDDL
jgi:ribosomal-protein-alanine N-acetyltransferase